MVPEPPSLHDAFKPDGRKTAAFVDTDTTPNLSGQNQKKPPKGLVCFTD